MQTLRSKKVNRLRSWIARNTENLVVCRFSCGMCSGRWHVAWTVSRNKLQSFIRGSRKMERRNATAFQHHSCWKGPSTFANQRLVICEVWNDNSLEHRQLLSGFSHRAYGDATRADYSGQFCDISYRP